MAASYPTASKSFSTKATNDVIEAAHVNDLQDEVTAIETALLTGGLAHNLIPSTTGTRDLGTSALLWRVGYLSDALVLGAATTAGIRLDLEAGVLALREGDDSAYAAMVMAGLTATTGAFSGDVTLSGAAGVLALSGATSAEVLASATNLRAASNGSVIVVFDKDNNGAESVFFRKNNATDVMEIDENATADETPLKIAVAAGAPQRVSVGAADSGGAGFRVLRVAN